MKTVQVVLLIFHNLVGFPYGSERTILLQLHVEQYHPIVT